jgi:hypothetical protein
VRDVRSHASLGCGKCKRGRQIRTSCRYGGRLARGVVVDGAVAGASDQLVLRGAVLIESVGDGLADFVVIQSGFSGKQDVIGSGVLALIVGAARRAG